MRTGYLIKTKRAYLACDNDIKGMTKVPTALRRAAKVDRLILVGLLRVAVRELNFLPKSRKICDNRVCPTDKMSTHCGFCFASGKIPKNVSIKAILGFNRQWQPWGERGILFEPKLDGLPAQEVVRNSRVWGGT